MTFSASLTFFTWFHKLIAALRIEAECRLVEEKNLGSVQKSAGDLETALHAAGELLHLVFAALPQFEEFQQFFRALTAHLVRHVIEHAVNFHVFQAVSSPSRLGSWKTMPKRWRASFCCFCGIEAVEFDGAAGGVQQRREHFDGCGLPCSVGTKEGEYLSCRHVERDIVDGSESAKCLYEVLHPDQCERPPGARDSILNGSVQFVNAFVCLVDM